MFYVPKINRSRRNVFYAVVGHRSNVIERRPFFKGGNLCSADHLSGF